MRKNDARQLDHATLEAMRERAVRVFRMAKALKLSLVSLGSIVRPFMGGWHNTGAVDGAH